MTVTGPIPASELGTTLAHEHVMVDWIGADSTGYHRWDRSEVINRMQPYFEEARDLGIQAVFECTPAYLGRDPFLLREMSENTGLRFVTNTGYYGAVDNRFIPAHAWEESAEELAARWIDEFNNGINGSDIRPGFMKISVAGEGALSDLHRKIVTAAALTHLETGLTIISHTGGSDPAAEQVELLKELGVDPSAWVWTHAQSGDLNTQINLGSQGAWISLDNFSYDPDREGENQGNLDWFRERLMSLKNENLLNRVLISHDAGYYNPDEEGGGPIRGYTAISNYLLPALLEDGFTQDEISQLLIHNPAEAFGIRVRAFSEGD
tara:strand:+ start:7458 stop:8423 length:966 start_codon:yes stop_codon:yes gene_type:complete